MSYFNFVDYPDELKRAIDNCEDCKALHEAQSIVACPIHQGLMNYHHKAYNAPNYDDIIITDIKNGNFERLHGRKPTEQEKIMAFAKLFSE